jgi:hypothetical protein
VELTLPHAEDFPRKLPAILVTRPQEVSPALSQTEKNFKEYRFEGTPNY